MHGGAGSARGFHAVLCCAPRLCKGSQGSALKWAGPLARDRAHPTKHLIRWEIWIRWQGLVKISHLYCQSNSPRSDVVRCSGAVASWSSLFSLVASRLLRLLPVFGLMEDARAPASSLAPGKQPLVVHRIDGWHAVATVTAAWCVCTQELLRALPAGLGACITGERASHAQPGAGAQLQGPVCVAPETSAALVSYKDDGSLHGAALLAQGIHRPHKGLHAGKKCSAGLADGEGDTGRADLHVLRPSSGGVWPCCLGIFVAGVCCTFLVASFPFLVASSLVASFLSFPFLVASFLASVFTHPCRAGPALQKTCFMASWCRP